MTQRPPQRATPLPVRFAGLQEALEGTPLDEERIQAHGIRKLSGKHLTLYTDLPPHPAIENSVISNRTRVEMENDDLQRMVLSLGNQRAGLYLH